MRSDLLLKIADELDAFVPGQDIKFFMGTWLELNVPKKESDCGTICCAIGLAVLKIPEVATLLGYNKQDKQFSPYAKVVEEVDGMRLSTSRYDYMAVRVALGLPSSGDAHYLFSSLNYKKADDPKIVSARIREYVRAHSKEVQ